ncbi:hypothetical protein D5086_027361 [Populus alba]|uniref:Uncharacterized protein n=1 Tax=Populus alba TaxID=43335 RepID=A0ACC4AW27_POPAL
MNRRKRTYKTVAKDVYQAALEEDWDGMIYACSGSSEMYVMSPVTVSEDTPLHLAVYSKKVNPLQALLNIAKKNPMLGNPYTKTNAYGNTVLHEAVFAGNMEAVEHLLNYDPSMQLQTKNKLGETPLYRAAACGLSAAKGDGDQSRSKKGWPVVERIRKEKHKHESALKLAKELIKKNQRKWWQSIKVKPTEVNIKTPGQGGRGGQSESQGGRGIPGEGGEGQEGAREGVDTGRGGGEEVENNENVQPKIEENRRQERPPSPPNPLFIATSKAGRPEEHGLLQYEFGDLHRLQLRHLMKNKIFAIQSEAGPNHSGNEKFHH